MFDLFKWEKFKKVKSTGNILSLFSKICFEKYFESEKEN